MAVTVAVITQGTLFHKSSVIATADADVAAVIPHGLPGVPDEVIIERVDAAAILSDWILGVIDDTNVNLIATSAVSSGDAAIQINVIAKIAHSIVK